MTDLDGATRQAAVLIDSGRPADALRLLAPVLATNPHDELALRLMSAAHTELGRHDEAVAAARAAVALDPADWRNLTTLSRALREGGDTAEAVDAARQARSDASYAPDTHITYAEALLADGRPFWARDAAREAVALAPWAPTAHDVLGRSELDCGDPAAAEAAFRAALAISPDEAVFLNNLGVARLRQGDRHGAAELFAAAARSDPSFDLPRSNTNAVVSNALQYALWVPLFIGLRLTAVLGADGQYGAAVLAGAGTVGVAALIVNARLPRAARAYVLNVLRLRVPTRGQAARGGVALGAYAVLLAASTRATAADRLLTASVQQAGLLAVVVWWLRTRPRREPPRRVERASARDRLVMVMHPLLASLAALFLSAPFWEHPWSDEVFAALTIGFVTLYPAWLDSALGGGRLRAASGATFVVRAGTAELPGFGRALLRAVVKAVTIVAWPLAVVSLLLVLFTPARRALHDLAAGTAVVRPVRR